MPRTTKNGNGRRSHGDLQDIRKDLDSLKTDIVALSQSLQADGQHHARAISKQALSRIEERIAEMENIGAEQFHRVEDHIREKPGQSMALAFAAGVALSYLTGWRDHI